MLDPAVMADPYPLYRQLREHGPVHWDPFMHSWLVTGYSEAMTVLRSFSADRAPRPAVLERAGLTALAPISQMMARQMLFMDAPAHTRLQQACRGFFSARRMKALRQRVQDVAEALVERALPQGRMDVVRDFAAPLPAIITAELLGVPAEDYRQVKLWSEAYAEMVGNAQHEPRRLRILLAHLQEMVEYFRAALQAQRDRPGEGLLNFLLQETGDAPALAEDEIVAMAILVLVGGQETTTNLIATGLLTLLRDPPSLSRMRDDPDALESGVEELLRHVSPTQHTARIAPQDTSLGGNAIRRGDAVTVVLAAANRDPTRFADPDRLDLLREDNRHLAFGWSTHFCLGAALARLEGAIGFRTLLRTLNGMALADNPLQWRNILILRGLTALDIVFEPR